MARRVLVVANRLPVTAEWGEGEGSWSLENSTGGLVSAIQSIQGIDVTWIGWPGVSVIDKAKEESLRESLRMKNFIPVFLDESTISLYYNGYSNRILWQILHSFEHPNIPSNDVVSQYTTYKKANKMFARVVSENYRDGDIVFIQDYHLMFLPKYLKKEDENRKVAWFLHTPFPENEILENLPTTVKLIQSILYADLIGFHTSDYGMHFSNACSHMLNFHVTPKGIEDGKGKTTHMAIHPIGINPSRFSEEVKMRQTQIWIEEIRKKYSGIKILLAIDRLDIIKGIPHRLRAYERFLEEHPEWIKRVILIQNAAPSREEVPEYQALEKEVEEIVKRVNDRWKKVADFEPIRHMKYKLPVEKMCALYYVADVFLVTSLKDGMNLVCYEYVACQKDKGDKGVLVMSKFAGAKETLGGGSVPINPWDEGEAVKAIVEALNMPTQKRVEMYEYNYKQITTLTAQKWGKTFISELEDIAASTPLPQGISLTSL